MINKVHEERKKFYEACKMLYTMTFRQAIEFLDVDMEEVYRLSGGKRLYIQAYNTTLQKKVYDKLIKEDKDLIIEGNTYKVIDHGRL